jgi:hypothetical protein
MAGQPTAQVDFFLLVTVDAEPHFEMLTFDAILGLHLIVAGDAFDPETDMALMVEQNMLRQKVGFHPWRRCPGIVIAVFLLDPPVIGNDVIMAIETFLHRRQTGIE